MVLVSLFIPFFIGILIGQTTNLDIKSWQFFAYAFGATLLSQLIYIRFKHRHWYGFVTVSAFVSLGIALATEHKIEQLNKNFNKDYFAVEILTLPQEKKNSFQYLAKILTHPDSSLHREKLILYQSKELNQEFSIGQQVILNQYVNQIGAALNPNVFNYKAYMAKQGIHYQAYITSNHMIAVKETNQVKTPFFQRLRNYSIQQLDEQLSKSTSSVAKALLLGYKVELSNATKREFSRAGTMHILAVSGLHVGIIYLMLSFVFTKLQLVFRYPKWINLLILLFGIYGFVSLTGAKASVLRAGLMFSLFAIGKTIYPKTNSINCLAGVAMLLLAYNPNYSSDVGFQLSFSAVLGILLSMPLFNYISVNNKFINYFIGIAFISVVAQFATLPLTVYYFHQFPTLGIFANLVAIPLSFAIVCIGFISLMFANIPYLSTLFFKLLEGFIQLLNLNNEFISNLSFSTIEQLSISNPLLCLLFAFVFLLLIHIKSKYNLFLYGSLISLFGFICMLNIEKWTAMQINSVVLYNVNQNVIVDHIQQRKSNLYSLYPIDETTYTHVIQPNHLKNYVQNNQYNSLPTIETIDTFIIQIILDTTTQIAKNADVLILHQPSKELLNNELLRTKQVIISDLYKPTYYELPTNYHFLKTDGWFTIAEGKLPPK